MRRNESFADYLSNLENLLSACPTDSELFQTIVDAPFTDKLQTTNIDLGMIVFVLADPTSNRVNRITYSNTSPAVDAVKASPKPFKDIHLPLDSTKNLTAKAVRTGTVQKTSDWSVLFTPSLSPAAARFNQAESGMGCSFIYPLTDARDGGGLIYSFYQSIGAIGAQHQKFMSDYTLAVSKLLR